MPKTIKGLTREALLQALWFAALTATVIGELLPGNSTAMRWVGATHINDKTLHFTAYAVLAFLPVFGCSLRRSIPVVASMILLGVGLEFAQRLVPFRSFEVADMVANTMGALAGMVVAMLGQAWMARESMTPEPPSPPARHKGSACPSCGALNVHRSHRKGITEHLLALVGAKIRRCHACNARFARLFNSAVYVDDARRAMIRAALLLVMLAGATVVVLVMLWFMKKQAAIGPSDCLLVGLDRFRV